MWNYVFNSGLFFSTHISILLQGSLPNLLVISSHDAKNFCSTIFLLSSFTIFKLTLQSSNISEISLSKKLLIIDHGYHEKIIIEFTSAVYEDLKCIKGREIVM